MADRFFPNVMPDFVSEIPTLSSTNLTEQEAGSDSLMKLLSMPYPSLSQHFKRIALDLKETVLSLSIDCDVKYYISLASLPTDCLCYCLTDCKRDVGSEWKTRA